MTATGTVCGSAVDEGLIPCDGELRGKVFVDALKKAAEIAEGVD